MLPNITDFASGLALENVVLSEEEANQDFDAYVDSLGEKEACYTIDASARTTGDKFFTRSTKLCAQGFDKGVACIVGIRKAIFECPNPSILAIVSGNLYNTYPGGVNVGFREDWDNVGRPQGSTGAQLSLEGCNSYGATRSGSYCGNSTYNLFHEPVLSQGYGLFDKEPCGTYQSVDCKVGDGEALPSSLGHCTWVKTAPSKAPTDVVVEDANTKPSAAVPPPTPAEDSKDPTTPAESSSAETLANDPSLGIAPRPRTTYLQLVTIAWCLWMGL